MKDGIILMLAGMLLMAGSLAGLEHQRALKAEQRERDAIEAYTECRDMLADATCHAE